MQSCEITNATDGSEDGRIHCFKEICPRGLELLTQGRRDKELEILEQQMEEFGLELDQEDGYGSDESIE